MAAETISQPVVALDAGSTPNGPPRKLRDSCFSCSSSKVKCSKEKPTCSRCARRGLVCGYMASRRTGRTSLLGKRPPPPPTVDPENLTRPHPHPHPHQHQHQHQHHQNHNITANRARECHAPSKSPSPPYVTPALTPPSTAGTISDNGMHSSPDVWRAILSPGPSSLDDPALSSLSPSATNFDDLFASVFSPILENPSMEAPLQSDPHLTTPPPPAMVTLDEMSICNQDLFTNDDFGIGDLVGFGTPPPEPRRCCMSVAMELMMQLFPNAPTACTMPGSQPAMCTVPTMESVISENKRIIEAITKLLDCPCSQDEYLLAIVSLVVFKVMAWYSAAAGDKSLMEPGLSANNPFVARPEQAGPTSFGEHVRQVPTTIGSYCVDGNDRSRMAAQLVLSELHRVQRLVNSISKRLESIRVRNCSLPSPSSASSCYGDSGDSTIGDGKVTPLSAPTFSQLETDLRKRLRMVSSETIDILRRE